MEYSLALAGVVGAVILAVVGLGDKLTGVFECFGDQLSGGSSLCATADGPGDGRTGPRDGTEPTGGPVEGPEPTATTTSATTTSTTITSTSTSTTTSSTTTSSTTTDP